MPINYSRQLAGKSRSRRSNTQLGLVLAFVAGAINAGGFLAVAQYTSHMTGIVSAMADHIALGAFGLALAGLGTLASFLCGAVTSTVMVNFSRRHVFHSEYAFPLLVEALLLLSFGLLGAGSVATSVTAVSLTIVLLSFIMGLQNALITKLSHAEIRTTHITGIVTDIGIEIGRFIYSAGTRADRAKIVILTSLLVCFFIGGVIGAFGFKHLGYIATVPLAVTLMGLIIGPIADDLKDIVRKKRRGLPR